jgi:tellurite resistance protein TerC
MLTNELVFFSLFLCFVGAMLALDLGIFSKKSHAVSFKEAAGWSAVWVMIAMLFSLFLRSYGHLIHGIVGPQHLEQIRLAMHSQETFEIGNWHENLQMYRNTLSQEFLAGYIMEYALSVDNIFVMILIFNSFGVIDKYHKKILFWGVLGAIVFRFTFIFLGAALLHRFEWIMYLFGAFLLYTGVKMVLTDSDDNEQIDTQKHPIIKMASKYLNVFPRTVKDYFFIRSKGLLMVTPLFLVLIIIEVTDLVFAVDSVPAVFAITKDPYVVFFSNIFAIMGLRSMFFFLANVMHLFHFLKFGLSLVLVYIGLKMCLHPWLAKLHINATTSLVIISSILMLSVAASLLWPQKTAEVAGPDTK